VERRRRISPVEAGLADRRGSRGLSQADVAALAGISLNWYAMFESGREDRRVSSAFLEAIAGALRLDEREKIEFFRLAIPRTQVTANIAESLQDGVLLSMRALRDLSRRIASASNLTEIATVVAESMQVLSRADSATMAVLRDGDGLRGFAAGPRSRYVSQKLYDLIWSQLRNLPADRVAVVQGGPTFQEFLKQRVEIAVDSVGESENSRLTDWQWTPEQYFEICRHTFVVNSISLPLVRGSRLEGVVTMAWTIPREFSRLEIETAKAVAALVQLATAARAPTAEDER
jgi:transcriptional regulator with XRE-family HTH domain